MIKRALWIISLIFVLSCSDEDEPIMEMETATEDTTNIEEPEEPLIEEPEEPLPEENLPTIDFVGGDVVMSYDSLSITIDPSFGARIASFSFIDQEMLNQNFDESHFWGSTFWTAPQSDWNWPPPSQHDRSAFAFKTTDRTATFTGSVSTSERTSISKEIWFDETQRNTLNIKYGITAETATKEAIAPWEVTRFPKTGLTFFELESGTPRVDNEVDFEQTDDAHVWIDFSDGTTRPAGKLFANGTGWIAHVDKGWLYLKLFEDIDEAQAADREAEVEIYVNESPAYIELEAQGAAARIERGDTYFWTVTWRAIELPEGIDVSIGSQELIELVQMNISTPQS